jgi:glycosyltransferase involved in cell wall biosynthesis
VKIAVVIPALNEAQCIGEVVSSVPRPLVGEVIVADNGSSDHTADAARAAGARVVREDRKGYGSACLAGVRAVTDADVIVFLDGDHSDDPREIPIILAPILGGQADLVIGSRVRGALEEGAIPPHQMFGNKVATTMIRWLYGLRLSDLGSFRAVRRSVLQDLHMGHPTYGWPAEMVVKAAKMKHRVVEVPITYRRRIGQSKVSGTLKGSLLAGYHIFTTILHYAWRSV